MKTNNFFHWIAISFLTVHRYAKSAFYLQIINSIIGATKVYVFAYVNKALLNELSYALLSELDAFPAIFPVAKLVFLNWCLVLLYNLIGKVFNYFIMSSLLHYDLAMNHSFGLKMASVDISYFDDPIENNKVAQVYRDMSAILAVFEMTLNLILSFISFVYAFVIILEFNWILTIIAFLALIPSFFAKKSIKRAGYTLEQKLNGLNRKTSYFSELFRNKSAAQDIRMSPSFKELIVEKYQSSTEEKNVQKRQLHKRNSGIDFLYSFIYGLIDAVINLYILFTIIFSKLSIGEFSFYTTIMGNFKKSVENCFSTISDLVISVQRVNNYDTFIQKKESLDVSGTKSVNFSVSHHIEFKHVTFQYPNTTFFVFQNLSFDFRTDQKIAFAGVNGAGKTTAIKLLLRFYDPTEGEILLDGINIREYDVSSYRELFSVMFQNYMNYCISIGENIALSPASGAKDDIISALKLSNIAFPCSAEQAVDMQYSKAFDPDGLMFSPGQAQRLNMARAIYRNSQVYIFDEPSASLDAKAEQDIFDKVFSITENKGVILISHRLSNLKSIDKIIFIENGACSESGKHDALMQSGGTYSKLYQIQLNGYVNENNRG